MLLQDSVGRLQQENMSKQVLQLQAAKEFKTYITFTLCGFSSFISICFISMIFSVKGNFELGLKLLPSLQDSWNNT